MRTGDDLRGALIALQPTGSYYEKELAPAPWGITINGREWFGATNGHVMVLIASPDALAQRLPEARDAATRDWFSGEGGDVVALADLAAFANVGAAQRPCATCDGARSWSCADCNGDGETTCECRCGHEHESTCDTCDGKGKIACPVCTNLSTKQYAHFFGHPVNRTVIRLLLETVGADEPAIRVSVHGDRLIYRLTPEVPEPQWMAVFMPLRAGTMATVDFDKPETWKATVDA